MSRTVTALYDTRAEAEAARQRLASTVDMGTARIIERPSGLDDLHMSADDRHVYQEGIRRGAFVLTAEVRGHEDPDKIIRVMEESASLDLDARQEQWRGEGWSSPPSSPTGASASRGPSGLRETGRGGARVRSYLREASSDDRMERREDWAGAEGRPYEQPIGGYYSNDAMRDHRLQPAPSIATGPSRAVIIGSAITGAVVGGVIGGLMPFLLADTGADRERRNVNPRRSQADQRAAPLYDDGLVRVIRK